MAGDSAAMSESTATISREPKVWSTGQSLVGIAGSFRIRDLLWGSGLAEPEEIRDFLLERATESGFPTVEWSALIVTRHGLYEIAEDFSIIEFSGNYASTGACAEACLAAMYVLESNKTLAPRRRMNLVVSAAIHHTTNARPPIKVISL